MSTTESNSPLPRPLGEQGPTHTAGLRTPPPGSLPSSTRPVRPELATLLRGLKPGKEE